MSRTKAAGNECHTGPGRPPKPRAGRVLPVLITLIAALCIGGLSDAVAGQGRALHLTIEGDLETKRGAEQILRAIENAGPEVDLILLELDVQQARTDLLHAIASAFMESSAHTAVHMRHARRRPLGSRAVLLALIADTASTDAELPRVVGRGSDGLDALAEPDSDLQRLEAELSGWAAREIRGGIGLDETDAARLANAMLRPEGPLWLIPGSRDHAPALEMRHRRDWPGARPLVSTAGVDGAELRIDGESLMALGIEFEVHRNGASLWAERGYEPRQVRRQTIRSELSRARSTFYNALANADESLDDAEEMLDEIAPSGDARQIDRRVRRREAGRVRNVLSRAQTHHRRAQSLADQHPELLRELPPTADKDDDPEEAWEEVFEDWAERLDELESRMREHIAR